MVSASFASKDKALKQTISVCVEIENGVLRFRREETDKDM
jgi:hypothetical protein